MHNFTPEDLLEYHYGEMPANRAIELEQAIQSDWSLREKLKVIEEASSRLDKSMYAPREETLQKIMAYAAQKIEQAVEEK